MKSFVTSLLYVFSGTGNTYRVASWIRDFSENIGLKTSLKFIDEADFQRDFQETGRQLIHVLFPTHGFMPPWSVIKFLFRIPHKKGVPAVIIATRGALYLGPIKIPGVAGASIFFAAMILFFKGYDIRGLISLDMAANMNNLHPRLNPDKIKRISEKAKQGVGNFLQTILSGKRVFFTLNCLYEGIWTILLFWLIPVFPVIYLIYGKTFMAKVMFSNNKCVGCGMCEKICPNHAIEMKQFLGKKRPFWTYRCENCMRCMGYCTRNAVEAGHSWAVIIFFILTIPVMSKAISWVLTFAGISFEIKNYWFKVLVDALYFLPAIFLLYWVFWVLNRFKVINTVFSVTSLTHYFKRYHEPETGLKKLVTRDRDGFK